MKVKVIKLFFLLCIVVSLSTCYKDSAFPKYKTQNIFIVIMDGARYSETWGDPTHQYIPRMANELAPQGVVCTNFYNEGTTNTISGHTAFLTGNYQDISNSGYESPSNPSVFQYWNKTYNKVQSLSWIISSKDKLSAVADCSDPKWKGQYCPSFNCGINGLGTGNGYRDDSTTLDIALNILSMNHPHLVLLSFRDPDYTAHLGDWHLYLNAIRNTDEFVYRLWKYLQNDPLYNGSTTMFVTNDHGRHLDSISGGFASHGDGCEGCRHVSFFACGPDFKQGVVISQKRELIDISATIAELFQFSMPTGKGSVMEELFKK